MAEDASNAARDAADAARHPHPGLLGRARERLVRDWANEAEDRAEDARDRADDARDRIDDARDRAQEAEDAARRAREWMSDKGFYTTEEYWDCDRYRGSEALEDQPLACIYANETRALAKVVRWRSDRIEARADMAEALASRAQAFADLARAERLEEERRAAVREVAERELERTNGRVAEVNELFAQQNEEWQRIQELSGGWIEGAEQSYAMLKDDGRRRVARGPGRGLGRSRRRRDRCRGAGDNRQ